MRSSGRSYASVRVIRRFTAFGILLLSVGRGRLALDAFDCLGDELVSPRTEQELDDVPFVRLQPVQLDVGIGPMFRRSMCVASVSCRWKFASSVIALHTSVGPIDSSIFSCGHFTTVVNGNMYSFLAIARSGESHCDHGRTQVGAAFFLDQARTEFLGQCA